MIRSPSRLRRSAVALGAAVALVLTAPGAANAVGVSGAAGPAGPGGRLPSPAQLETIPLTGDYQHEAEFNLNGISRTPDRQALLAVQTNTGLLFRIDPATGATVQVDLGGADLPAADGLLLRGRTLYVVQNLLEQVAVIRLNPSSTAGTIVDEVTDPRFDIPTTVAAYGNRLCLPNAQFIPDATPTTEYQAVAVPIPRD